MATNVILVLLVLALCTTAWGQTEPPVTTDGRPFQQVAVISRVRVNIDGDTLESIVIEFETLADNPFDYDYDDNGHRILEMTDCIANKLVFTDGVASFKPQYNGACGGYQDRISIYLDNEDYLDFIQAGFLTRPLPTLFLYTTESALEGEFPLVAITQEQPLNVSYMVTENTYTRLRDVTYNSLTGVLLLNFATFVQLSSLNISQILLSSNILDEQTPNTVFNLTGGTVITKSVEGLAIDVAIAITAHDLSEIQARNICRSFESCRMFNGPGLVESFSGLPVFNNLNGRYPRFIAPVTLSPVYMELSVQYFGYTMQVPLQYLYPYHIRYYGYHHERVVSLNCFADGIIHTDPELYLGGKPVDEQYLTRNWPTQITLATERGLVLKNLVGYFSCKTRDDSFNSSNIITHLYNYIYFLEGDLVEVSLHDSVIVPFAHNYNYNPETENIMYLYSLAEYYNPPPFEYTTIVSQISPFIVEFHISNLQFSDSGRYLIIVYGHFPLSGGFNITVLPPTLTLTPANLYVLPTTTVISITCTTTHPTVGTAWILPGARDPSSVVYSETNTLQFDVTPGELAQLEGALYECVAYDPDIEGPPQVVSSVKTSLQIVTVIPPGAEFHTLIIELEGFTTQTFTVEVQSTFKQITANSINSYCEDNVCERVSLAEISDRKKRAGHSFDADDLVITNIQAVDDNTIQFYMYADHDGILEGGALLNAILDNIDEYSNKTFFLNSADRLATPSPSLTLEQIIGIAVGGGVFVVIVIIALVSLCACCCIQCSKKREVKKHQDFVGGHVENPVYSEPTPEGDGEKAKEVLGEEEKPDLTAPKTA